ncbi:RNA polymerase, sigma-24 subunit, ECF subfamily [Pseudobacteroides cellulosolvens ATCC 35603 = DSM 2933]|uniref:RNA polymerase, sigma-24 subunit, ECF subfamily n=2 Tax=Pseudobacteroides cellulosolvens TaxID=35825 RepID=A0A0L6JXP7_9FIRM|nr:RNA polymerase, sigma-24 subunit, ECF subfamily [Pseudobacteroides cellulosolvens ATCC 35603 = DSM 2933]
MIASSSLIRVSSASIFSSSLNFIGRIPLHFKTSVRGHHPLSFDFGHPCVRLSNNLKTVVILHYFNGMSIEEISKVTGSLRATVKTRLYYARNVLRKKLENAVDESSESFMEGRNIKKASYYR